MKITLSNTATVEVPFKTLDLMDGFGWADGGESCCFAWSSAIEHLGGDHRGLPSDMERAEFLNTLRTALREADITPDDIILIKE